ncbi:hypothetical protein IE4771_PA00069 (plasmid) [Rhizobium etli bv. mimosae str. IE4771]|uniref:Uncharacterized protein n=1 Tax=Rhizobium etli bv. mimosae str. IE4771 TaxID=1432050 RepID=A0A060IBZ3_RHIET|nr:hypothetical protein IE4771_PA00069 [Rhizobium sp. IE4771]
MSASSPSLTMPSSTTVLLGGAHAPALHASWTEVQFPVLLRPIRQGECRQRGSRPQMTACLAAKAAKSIALMNLIGLWKARMKDLGSAKSISKDEFATVNFRAKWGAQDTFVVTSVPATAFQSIRVRLNKFSLGACVIELCDLASLDASGPTIRQMPPARFARGGDGGGCPSYGRKASFSHHGGGVVRGNDIEFATGREATCSSAHPPS